jgi:hypothetical protein
VLGRGFHLNLSVERSSAAILIQYDVNPVKNNETQQRKGTQDRSMDRFEGMTLTRCYGSYPPMFKTKVRKKNNKIKDLTNHSLTCLHSRIWITLHSCFTQNNMALTLRCSHHSCLFSLDNSLLVLLKLNKQLKISSNNSPRTNQGISDLNIRNMEFFSLELGVW